MTGDANECDCWKLHAKYIVGILLGVVTFMAGIVLDLWKVSSHAIDLAATLSGILLAVVSIFYAFMSTETLNRDLSNIRSSADRVGDAAHEVKSAATDIVARVSEALRATSKEVKDSVASALASTAGTSSAPIQKPSKEAIDRFYRVSSARGIVAMYALYLATKQGVKFDLRTFAQATRSNPTDGEYELAFFVAASGAGFINSKNAIIDSVEPTYVAWPEERGFANLLLNNGSFKRQVEGRSEEEKLELTKKYERQIETYLGSIPK